MPIRFRCNSCGGVLAIARRKAGSNVLCPKCAGSLVVPGASTVPDPEKVEVPVRGAVAGEPIITSRAVGSNGTKKKKRSGSKPAEEPPLFEKLDFESLLSPTPKESEPVKPALPPEPKVKSTSPPVSPAPSRFTPRPPAAKEKPASAPTTSPAAIQISRVQLIALVVLVFCLVAMGVGVGYALGKP